MTEFLSDLTTETVLMLFGIELQSRFLSQIRWEPVKLTKEARETNQKKEQITIQIKTKEEKQKVLTVAVNTTSTKLPQMESK